MEINVYDITYHGSPIDIFVEFGIIKAIKIFQLSEDTVMEKYIFLLYQKRLKEIGESKFWKFPQLNMVNVLLYATFILIIALTITIVFECCGVWGDWLPNIIMISLLILCIVIYFVTNKNQIIHSDTAYQKYKDRSHELKNLLIQNQIPMIRIPNLIQSYADEIDKMDKKIANNFSHIHKYIQIFIIPLTLNVLAKILEPKSSSNEIAINLKKTLETSQDRWFNFYNTFAILSLILLICGIWFLALFIYSLKIENDQEKYRQIKNDLQGIIDLGMLDKPEKLHPKVRRLPPRCKKTKANSKIIVTICTHNK